MLPSRDPYQHKIKTTSDIRDNALFTPPPPSPPKKHLLTELFAFKASRVNCGPQRNGKTVCSFRIHVQNFVNT